MKRFLYLFSIAWIFCCTKTLAADKAEILPSVKDNVYTISTSDEFKDFITLVNQNFFTVNDTILLLSDIDFNGASTATQDFISLLDGGGHKIENISRTLFDTNRGVIKDLELNSGHISGFADVAPVCITNHGTITGCISRVNVSASAYNEYMHVAGIAAYNYGDIINCTNYGNLTCSLSDWSKEATRCGGIASYSKGKGIIHCINHGDIITKGVYSSLTGGIVGDLQGGKVIGCENYGKVSSSLRSATLSEYVSWTNKLQYTGGILGQAQENSLVNRCRNYGNISSNFQYVGGIAGQVSKTSIFNVVNFGDVTSNDGYGYSCAAGITGYSHGVSANYYFYNCINHGKITSTAHYDVATSAGISMELTKCYVANCINTGGLEATVLGGTATRAFRIPTYEYEDCRIDSQASSPAEANDFISQSADSPEELLGWYVNDNSLADLYETFISYPVPTFGDCTVFIFPETDNLYTLEVSGNEISEPLKTEGISPVKVSGLKPDASYSYTIKNNLDEYNENGKFSTLKPTINFEIQDSSYDFINITQTCSNQGVSDYKCLAYVESESGVRTVEIEESESAIENLEEDTEYSIYLGFQLNGKTFKSETLKVSTKPVVPEFSLIEATPYSLKLKCDNFQELTKFSPSLFIEAPQYYNYGAPLVSNDQTFALNSDGIVEITGLQYGYTPRLMGEYVFNGETRRRPSLQEFSTLNWGGEGVIQVSEKAAMIHGLFGGLNEKIPESWNFGSALHYYRDHFFQYGDATNSESSDFKTISGATIDGGVDIAVTIPIDSPYYQYLIRIQDDRTYYGKYTAKDGEWQFIDATNPTVEIVEPRFFAPRFDNNNISISFIDGEQPTKKVSLLYKMENLKDFNEIILQDGPGTNRLDKTFSTLIPSVAYLFRFYSLTDSGLKYYSKTYRLLNGEFTETDDESSWDDELPGEGEENPELGDDDDAGINAPVADDIKIIKDGSFIRILNIPVDAEVRIYDLNGRLIYAGQESLIQIGQSGVYILKYGNRILKFMI